LSNSLVRWGKRSHLLQSSRMLARSGNSSLFELYTHLSYTPKGALNHSSAHSFQGTRIY
jgi:hypothetical protein